MSIAFVPPVRDTGDSCVHVGDWTERVVEAARKYGQLGPDSPELIDAVADGLRRFAAGLPLVDYNDSGQHIPANSWAMGPEVEAIEAIVLRLTLCDHVIEAGSLKSYIRRLAVSAASLDGCYPADTAFAKQSELRLVEIVRSQALQLAGLLQHFRRMLFAADVGACGQDCEGEGGLPVAGQAAAKRNLKRAARMAHIEALKKELIAHIRSAQENIRCQLQVKREPMLLPRPSKSELAARVNMAEYTVSRCFKDSSAYELRFLWDVADNMELIEQYRKR